MGVMEGRDSAHIKDKFKDLYQPLVLTNWQVWPLAQVCSPSSFIFTLQEFAKELASLVDAMGRIYSIHRS